MSSYQQYLEKCLLEECKFSQEDISVVLRVFSLVDVAVGGFQREATNIETLDIITWEHSGTVRIFNHNCLLVNWTKLTTSVPDNIVFIASIMETTPWIRLFGVLALIKKILEISNVELEKKEAIAMRAILRSSENYYISRNDAFQETSKDILTESSVTLTEETFHLILENLEKLGCIKVRAQNHILIEERLEIQLPSLT